MIGGEPIEVRRQKLWARVSRRVAPADQARVAEFIGELLDTPMRDEDPPPMSVRAGEQVSASPPSPGSSPSSAPPASPALRAARQDAQVMGDQIRKACLDLLEAECSDHPILLVLEDLHWCDPPTVRFIDAALRALRERPLMVLALARPEVHERFPKLWADRDVQEMRLRELTRKASERLVREVLGDRVGQGTLDRLVEQADGHAFFLEELIRAVAQGKGDALPDTVLAMVQARLFGLDAQSRRVLRAASVFGEHFWVGGVVALLGGVMRSTQTGDVLSALVEQEVIVRRAESRFPGDPEFAFRHALLREGAYGMLTESDRVLGHKLAAGYLDQSGETDPMVIAEHYERGRDPARAGSFYVRAAEQAFRGSDPDEGMRRAERGLQCGVPDALRIELLSLLAEGYVWRHQWRRAAGYAEEVMRLAEPGSAPWAKAAVAKLVNAQSLGRMDEFNQTLEQLFSVKPSPESLGVTVLCLSLTAFILDANGRFDLGAVCMGHLRALIEPVSASEAMESTLDAVGAQEALASEAPGLTPPPTRRVLESGVRPSDRARSDAPPGERLSDVIEAGYRMSYITAHLTFAMHLWMLGAQEEARREIDLTAGADELLGPAASIKAFYLVSVLADAGALEEARREAEVAVEQGKSKHLRVDEGRGRYALGDVLRRAGELSAAEREVTAAIDLLTIVPLDHLAAMATLAAIKLAAGRTAEALELSDEVVKRLEALGGFDYKGAFARAVHAEALHAAGDVEAARRAIAAARARLLENAGRISDPELRRSYLERVPENARTMELARAWVDCA
jgi:tetratricopeptide (TPR) repeat protein